jgi:hypothetical protein
MKKTLRFAALAAVLSLTSWLSNAHALPQNICDFKQGMPCRFIGPSQPCQWYDGQAGYCGCVDRDHYECARI